MSDLSLLCFRISSLFFFAYESLNRFLLPFSINLSCTLLVLSLPDLKENTLSVFSHKFGKALLSLSTVKPAVAVALTYAGCRERRAFHVLYLTLLFVLLLRCLSFPQIAWYCLLIFNFRLTIVTDHFSVEQSQGTLLHFLQHISLWPGQ